MCAHVRPMIDGSGPRGGHSTTKGKSPVPRIKLHKGLFAGGLACLGFAIAYDVAAFVGVVPPLERWLSADIRSIGMVLVPVAAVLFVLDSVGQLYKSAIAPVRQAFLYGYQLRDEHLRQEREAAAQQAAGGARLLRLPIQAYAHAPEDHFVITGQTPQPPKGPRHRASRRPGPKR